MAHGTIPFRPSVVAFSRAALSFFQEEEINTMLVPNFAKEDRAENLRLARLWDSRGLLQLTPQTSG